MSSSISWPVVRLAELAASHKGAIAGGPFGSDLVSADYVSQGVPVIRGVNLPQASRLALDNVVFVSEAKADALHLNCALPGDLVFTQRGTLGQIGFIPKESTYARYVISQSQMKMTVDARKADALYLYYYFSLPSTVQYIENHALQSGVPHINLGILRRLEVVAPPPAVQRKIAAILSAYDDLIANNQRRIALLETVAEEIYREWFVRMRFPGYGSAVHKGLLPDGWTRKRLGGLAAMITRGVSPDYSDTGDGIVLNQRCIRDGKVTLAEARRHQTRFPDERLIRYGDILINSTGVGTLGRVAVYDLEVEDLITCDSHVTILRPQVTEVQANFLASTVHQLQSYFESMAEGSTGQAELGRRLISRTKVVVPPRNIQERYAEHALPIQRQRRALIAANERLAQQRDALLPRLISGKLKVDHLDIRLPPSMQDGATA